MTPDTLTEAVALFASSAPLAPLYSLDHEPGAQQRALVSHVLSRIEDNDGEREVVLFPGAAGTGKTTTLKLLLTILRDCDLKAVVGAPTHKAASQARKALDGIVEVTTHHRWWCSSAVEEIKEGEEFGDNLSLGVAEDRVLDADVAIVDESSMLSEGDVAAIWSVYSGVLIAVGDYHQLPPVGGDYGIDWSDAAAIELTDVFRQRGGSPVLDAATAIREQLVPFNWSKVADWRSGVQILKNAGVPTRWSTADETGLFLARCLEDTDGDAACVVGTHVSRVLVNDATRSHLGLPVRSLGPAVGERLVSRRGAAGIHTAMTCIVKTVQPQYFGERFGAGWILTVQTEEDKIKTACVLEQQWLLTDTPSNRGKIPYSIDKMMKAYCSQEQSQHGPAIAEIVAPRLDAWYDAHEGEVDAKDRPVVCPKWLREIWKAEAAAQVGAWALYLSKYLGALDTGYAVTCHAAQGSQYRKVIIVADWVDFLAENRATGKVDPDAVYKWSYTALTRAVEAALVITKSKGGWERPSSDSVTIGTASRDWQARRNTGGR